MCWKSGARTSTVRRTGPLIRPVFVVQEPGSCPIQVGVRSPRLGTPLCLVGMPEQTDRHRGSVDEVRMRKGRADSSPPAACYGRPTWRSPWPLPFHAPVIRPRLPQSDHRGMRIGLQIPRITLQCQAMGIQADIQHRVRFTTRCCSRSDGEVQRFRAMV
jgi:hypothetical protein